MKRYSLLDIFRFICACLVVVIHLGPDIKSPIASMIVVCFSQQAVPFFFIVSGFFFANKLKQTDKKLEYVWGYVKKMLFFYCIWVILLLPQTVREYSELYENRAWLYIALLIARRVFLAGLAQFWYILALAETALIAGLLLVNNKRKVLYGISCVGFIMGIIYCAEIPFELFRIYNKVMYTIFSWNCNFLMSGLPFFAVGIFLAEKCGTIRPKTTRLIFAYALVSLMAIVCYMIAQRVGILPDRVMYFYSVQAILLFLIGIQFANIPISQKTALSCRESSSAIYCLHNLVIEYFLGNVMPWSVHFAVNYAAVILVCVAIYWIVKCLKITPIDRLITLKG